MGLFWIFFMAAPKAEPVSIALRTGKISGLLAAPAEARACYVMAHGAGAGMAHPFMAAVAAGLAERGIATLRYQFPYMERAASGPIRRRSRMRRCAPRSRRRRGLPELPLFAGGKSFGGRMTSQAQAAGAAARRARAGVLRLSAAPGGQAVATSAPRICAE